MRGLKSPSSKSALKSSLGMFSWFANRSAIKDLMGPLRAVAKTGVRFYWSPELEASFRAVISAILDPITNCLRPPKGGPYTGSRSGGRRDRQGWVETRG